MTARWRGLGWVAVAVAVIAGLFIAVVIRSRGSDPRDERAEDALEKFGAEQAQLAKSNATSCNDAAENNRLYASNLDDALLEELQRVTANMCTQDQWPNPVRRCLYEATSEAALPGCVDRLSRDQADRYHAALQAAVVSQGYHSPSLPPACDRYRKAIERLSSCPQFPPQSRDALKQAYDAMSQAWGNMPPAGYADLADTCDLATQAVEQAVASICP